MFRGNIAHLLILRPIKLLESIADPPTVPDEGFIGAEPKLKPTTIETAPANFALMTTEKLQHTFKCSPAYGRLSKDDDVRSSIPNGPSSLPKKPVVSGHSQYPSQVHLIESKVRILSSPIFLI
jgi:hypothetical protein